MRDHCQQPSGGRFLLHRPTQAAALGGAAGRVARVAAPAAVAQEHWAPSRLTAAFHVVEIAAVQRRGRWARCSAPAAETCPAAAGARTRAQTQRLGPRESGDTQDRLAAAHRWVGRWAARRPEADHRTLWLRLLAAVRRSDDRWGEVGRHVLAMVAALCSCSILSATKEGGGTMSASESLPRSAHRVTR